MVLKEIQNRRSIRDYSEKEVPEEYILEIIKAGQFAPSAHNNQAREFIIVKDKNTKEKIFEIVGQEFVKEAPVLIIPVTDETKTNCPVEDLAVASENMFLQATALGLGTVWKAMPNKDCEKRVKEILGIPDNFLVINIIPVGYPKEKVEPHKEGDFDQSKIHFERW